MRSWLVLLTACSMASQAPEPQDGPRPKLMIVKADEYQKEVDRLEKRHLQLYEDAEYLEALLAKKKAEAEAAKADLTLYQLTHDFERTKEAAKPATADDPDPAPPAAHRRSRAMLADDDELLIELPTKKEKEKAKAESEQITFRGRVVDANGQAIAGTSVIVENSPEDKKPFQIQTDPKGDYSLTIPVDQSFGQIQYDAKGHARRVVDLAEHGFEQRRLVKLEPGVCLRGSIVHQGQPVAKIKVNLNPTDGTYPGYLGEFTAITDNQGEFTFNDLPAEMEVTMSFDIDSLKHLGAIGTRTVRAPSLKESKLRLDPIEVGPSFKVAGQVIFRDGKKIPAGSTLSLRIDGSSAGQQARLDADGRFEVAGMPPGVVFLSVVFPNNEYAPKGYRFSSENVSLDHSYPFRLVGKLDRDINDLKVLFEPGPAWTCVGGNPGADIPSDQADFETQTLTGSPTASPKP
jgi:hypothetical protein